MKSLHNLRQAFQFIESLLKKRLEAAFSDDPARLDNSDIKLPEFKDDDSPFFDFLQKNNLTFDELVVLVLAIMPHLQPAFLGRLITTHLQSSGNFPELGGVKSDDQRYFLPTGETVMFLLIGNDWTERNRILHLFSSEHFFHQKGILELEKVKRGMPKITGRILIDDEWVELLTEGKKRLPKLSMEFPATHLTTQRDWDDLILPQKTIAQIQEIKDWILHHDKLLNDWGLGKKIKSGFRALFHGPPGTGKTLTATLLGKYTGLEVFRIDLSMVVSKYIGETEKNLATLFNKAENKNWILFFDEADALFGKRTQVRDAHDKYANQEVAYLLQRIENFPGLVILASNFKANIDTAFTRRFNSVIHFPMPSAQERFLIWSNAFPKKVKLAKDVDIEMLAKNYELSGSNIMNVVQYACLRALAFGKKVIRMQFILQGIRKEFEKEGKMI